ncbi:MAG: prepilin-type N-terminal cleavage/methylation domain-containing protein [Opitutales bacterium]|nr:prepilin-type N-terminal cleavage/methylation domain-containing protein [Opitutales bacterium]
MAPLLQVRKRQLAPKLFSSCKGFTLIEAVAVLALLGILSAIGFASFNRSNNDLSTEADIFASHLRYTQARALADIRPWRLVIFNNGREYRIENPENTAIRIPGSKENARTFKGGIQASELTVEFDQWGRPSGATQSVVVTLQQGSKSQNLVITQETGWIR